MIRRLLLWIGALGGLWLAPYAGLSLAGGYVPTDGVLVWQPRWCLLQRRVASDGRSIQVSDGLGDLYAPLIILDRRYIHDDQPVPPPGKTQRHTSDW